MRGQKWKNVASFQQRRGEEKRKENRIGNIILGRENSAQAREQTLDWIRSNPKTKLTTDNPISK